MNVKELITELQNCNHDFEVFIWSENHERKKIDLVDNCLTDCVDINVKSDEYPVEKAEKLGFEFTGKETEDKHINGEALKFLKKQLTHA